MTARSVQPILDPPLPAASGRVEDGRKFVQLRRDAVAELCQANQLGPLPRLVLRELLELVDWRTATLACTQTDIADYLGLAGGHGRRQLADALTALQAAGAIECHWSRGRTGTVTVTAYDQLVRRQTPVETTPMPLRLVDPTPPTPRTARPTRAGARPNDLPRANDQPQRPTDVDGDKTEPPQPPGGGGGLRQPQELVTDAVAELVAREQALNVTPVRNPAGWQRSVQARLAAEHGERLLELATAAPELSAAALADLVAPRPKPTRSAIPEAAARPHAARCPECDDQHIVEFPPDPTNIYGTVGPCPLCRPTAPTASATPASAAAPSAGPSGRRPEAGETEPQPIRLLLEAVVTTRKVNS